MTRDSELRELLNAFEETGAEVLISARWRPSWLMAFPLKRQLILL